MSKDEIGSFYWDLNNWNVPVESDRDVGRGPKYDKGREDEDGLK